ncbi:hypothetical protein [Mesorhizobium sp. M2A.F.Ca.ET.043.02.1.1]|uniref:hypothetical protein n=1 Tax=Mesorhizobium sp. M2A.F.Ca.ET.043.02.1.1 TaxID=2493670 RepID=UPI000F7556D2|nr:hypothetical protein [Mesorhizobium sp. M2A.F.Ca.ET.043.02.1.1]AZO04560.1 hypothetical protein EJ068_16940 [Mesorhizobium sp. M2A.F.Ca.ET.043.02.1.1]TIU57132.1 MAG: hypothetical protein E5W35_10325 [Mesorhizobium sp.]
MSLLASASFNGRLVPREVGTADYEFPAPASQEPDRATAGAIVRASAVPFTEPCGDAPLQVKTAPADATPGTGAVTLSEASRFILSLIAAHEGRSTSDILAELIAAAADAIGISALLSRGADDIGDIADLPGYARKAANRFRSGGP